MRRGSISVSLCPIYRSVFGSRGFRSAGPAIWNSLPLSITTCSTIHAFKKQLKTHLFASAFPSSWIVLDAPLIRWSPLIYLFGCLWFCAFLNVCYYYYYKPQNRNHAFSNLLYSWSEKEQACSDVVWQVILFQRRCMLMHLITVDNFFY